MTLVTPTVEIWFDLAATGGDVWTLEDPVKGVLDGDTYGLAGDVAVDVSGAVYGLQFRRGRSRWDDEITAGVLTVSLRNYDGNFLPDGFVETVSSYGADAITIGRRVRVSVAGQTVFDGNIDDWDYVYQADRFVDCTFEAVDVLASLAAMDFDQWTSTGGETAGSRIEAILDRPEVDFGPERDIDAGVNGLQTDLVTWGSNVLSYAQLVARSDVGRLFASREGVLTFRDRHSTIGVSPRVSFSDEFGVGIPIAALSPQYGSELLFNRVGVDRENGELQTVNDSASQAKYRIRSLNVAGVLLQTDSQALDMADWLLYLHKEPQANIESLSVVLEAVDESSRGDVVGLELGDKVSVKWNPKSGDDLAARTYIVEGIRHASTVDGPYRVDLSLTPDNTSDVWILEDATLGALDTGGVLAY